MCNKKQQQQILNVIKINVKKKKKSTLSDVSDDFSLNPALTIFLQLKIIQHDSRSPLICKVNVKKKQVSSCLRGPSWKCEHPKANKHGVILFFNPNYFLSHSPRRNAAPKRRPEMC